MLVSFDPLSLTHQYERCRPALLQPQVRRGDAEHLLQLLQQEPRFTPALFNLGRVYIQKEMYDEAIAAFEGALKYSGNRGTYPALAHAYARAGRTEEARRILNDLLEHDGARLPASPLIAQAYLGLGELDEAFEWLRRGIDERSPWVGFLKADPIYDEIRNDSRFRDLLKQIGLAPPGQEKRGRAASP